MVLLALTACSLALQPPSAVGARSTVARAATTRGEGGTLKLLYWQAPTILNSHLSFAAKDRDAARLVLEPLAALDPDGKPIPVLAADVPTSQNGGISAGGTTVTWTLKPNVKWSDGSDFTSADVVFTYQYLADAATASTDRRATEGIASVEAIDPLTVAVHFQYPVPNPYQIFVSANGVVLQKQQFEPFLGDRAKDAPANMQPIGTGPYRITEFKPGDVALYELNELYRDPDRPYFKQIQLKGGGDPTSAARAVLQVGEFDYAANVQVEWPVLNQLAHSGQGELVMAGGPIVERVLLNFADPQTEVDGARAEPSTQHPFLSDVRVRKALAMAIDRTSIADQLYGATGQATCNIVTAPLEVVSPNTSAMDTCRFDIARANDLLDEAGWRRGPDGLRQRNGVLMRMLFQTTLNSVRQKEQEIIKAGWAQLGIATELKAILASVYGSGDPGNPDTASKFYADAEMHAYGSADPDQTVYLQSWLTRQIAQQANSWRFENQARYSNPAFDALFDEYAREINGERRSQLVIQMNDLLIGDAVVIPLVARTSPTSARSRRLVGVVPNAWESELWNIADWSKTND
jgi:peptide/nickel transport system substrate-binding protein